MNVIDLLKEWFNYMNEEILIEIIEILKATVLLNSAFSEKQKDYLLSKLDKVGDWYE